MNSKTRNNKPVEDAPAPAAGDVMVEFNRLQSGLVQTHDEIPKLLRRQRELTQLLGEAEVRGDSADGLRAELDHVAKEREAAVRRRGAALQAILTLEGRLQSERQRAEAERQSRASEVIAEFLRRYDRAVSDLQALWAEGDLLSRTLKSKIEMRLPVKIATSVVTGIPTAEPIRSDAVAELDDATARVSGRLDQLNEALARVAAIKQSQQLDQRHFDLSRIRNTPADFPGVYAVTAAFDCLVDGLRFEVGQLIDASLVGPGPLQRLLTTRRHLRPAELTARAA
jgi:hypothetical protein